MFRFLTGAALHRNPHSNYVPRHSSLTHGSPRNVSKFAGYSADTSDNGYSGSTGNDCAAPGPSGARRLGMSPGGDMKVLSSRFIIGPMIVVVTACGCINMDRTLHYFGKSDLTYYKEVAQQVDYPFEEDPTPSADATDSDEPRTIQNRRKDEIREMSLMEAIHEALKNNRIIRSRGTFLSAGNSIYTNANGTPSTYDPAIQHAFCSWGRT